MSNKLSFPARLYTEVQLQGQTVRLLEPTEYDMQQFQKGQTDKNGNPNVARLNEARARLIVMCIVDEDRNRMFTEEDLGEVSQWPISVTKEIEAACLELIGRGKSKASLEDISKN